jgi:hypothetical protein
VILLRDVRRGIYATSGVLPRKVVTLPKEFLEAAISRMEPTFRVGPVLTSLRLGTLRVMVPPPSIDGHTAAFVQQMADGGDGPADFVPTPVPAAPPVAELPLGAFLSPRRHFVPPRRVTPRRGHAYPGM